MTPTDVRRFLRGQGPSTRDELAHAFGAEPGVVEAALDLWERKGRIVRRTRAPACGGCTSCGTETAMVYAWIDEEGGTKGESGAA